MAYTNSSLVNYTKLSSNHSGQRNHAIDTITIHCIVGQWTAKKGCDYFASTSRQASCNYVVGKDGSIGLCVEEKNRSWCSSSSSNDNRAVTIEVASDTSHPYAVTDAAYNALINLVADICKRNGIKKLVWSTNKTDRVNHKNGCNMTVHRDFANKSCPGEYLYSRHGDIANKVNAKLGVSTSTSTSKPVSSTSTSTNKTTTTTTTSKAGDVLYQAYANGKWWNYIKNYGSGTEGYAGVIGQPMRALRAYVKGTAKEVGYLEYRVHKVGGGWYNWQRDLNKDSNGENFAGDLKNKFDGLQMRIVGVSGRHVKYRVHVIGKGWLSWVTDYGSGNNGYAGWYGYAIDAVQIDVI